MKQKIKVNGLDLEINIETEGKSGQELLMVHGIPTNARLWRHVTALLKDRYKTYAMDMVGYGQSSMPLDDFEHTLTNQAEAIKEVIDGLGLKIDVLKNSGTISFALVAAINFLIGNPICFAITPAVIFPKLPLGTQKTTSLSFLFICINEWK